MLKQNARLIDLTLRLVDFLILVLALPAAHVAYEVLPLSPHPTPPISQFWGAVIGIMVLWVAFAGAGHVYGSYRARHLGRELYYVARALSWVALVVLAGLFLLDSSLSRLFMGLYFVHAFFLMAGNRLSLRAAARALRRSGYNTRRFAIVGEGKPAEELLVASSRERKWGYEFSGFILPDLHDGPPPRGRILGRLGDLERILEDEVLDEVIFALPRERLSHAETAVSICEDLGVTVLVSLGPLQLGTAPMSIFDLSGHPMLVFHRVPTDALALLAKRAFDLVVSGVALVALLPVFAITALAIKLDSPGPVFFKQVRVGLGGRRFSMIKFRSMYRDAEERLHALREQNEMTGPVFKMKNDPRITKVGRFIRKTSIDELPQFWNVFCGKMSIVGPRPPLPSEVGQYERWQRRRLSVRPGITCTWQISGRNSISFEQWMELDLEYIDNWTLKKDLEIFLRTIPAVLTTRGAQ